MMRALAGSNLIEMPAVLELDCDYPDIGSDSCLPSFQIVEAGLSNRTQTLRDGSHLSKWKLCGKIDDTFGWPYRPGSKARTGVSQVWKGDRKAKLNPALLSCLPGS